jgi:hypothetical protein
MPTTTTTTSATYDEDYQDATARLSALVDETGYPDGEYAKVLGDRLNNSWREGITVDAWVALAAASLRGEGWAMATPITTTECARAYPAIDAPAGTYLVVTTWTSRHGEQTDSVTGVGATARDAEADARQNLLGSTGTGEETTYLVVEDASDDD